MNLPIRQSANEMAAILRRRICFSKGTENEKLHEGTLAVEFGVSRTPIRQVLQRLAYERLIEVRSGVGSVMVPLSEDRREQEHKVACAMLNAAAECAQEEAISASLRLEVHSLGAAASVLREGEEELFFETRAKLLEVLAKLIPDEILRDGFRSSYWRLIRWKMRAMGTSQELVEMQRLAQMLSAATDAAETGGVPDLLKVIAEAEA
ncbi:GntR family transcriptional regulator [Alphaproteobacteria bacterium KMM 3653]|uniref:GntR family transcriptional regulator n=1 Tax=Harenicola maris TaxID=2841044 RepID=A0AAP2CRW7_9RHOB|nr:GntR family transcriptional regulator [Harenicola maris]